MPETRSLVEIAGRPEKPVACPRCESWNTKFCYYNNHNVNQPRHYCKGCQRYWTEGGSLRNVPVGAGKRKIRLNQTIPHSVPVETVSNTPDIFCFTGSDLGQGVYASSANTSFDVSIRPQVACSPGENKPLERPSVANPGESMVLNAHTSVYQVGCGSTPAQIQPYTVSTQQTAFNYEACKLQPFVSPSHFNQPIEKRCISDLMNKEAAAVPSLDLNLSKETGASEKEGWIPSSQYNNATRDVPLSHQQIAKQDVPRVSHERPVERDESTCCSAVTTVAIRSAVAEASNTASTRPGVDQSSGVANVGGAAWGASMWPWIWPFIFNGSNIVPPIGMPQVGSVCGPPQVDANVVSAIGAMATGSMPPVHPAVAAALGAIAAGHMPQVPQMPQMPQVPQVPQMPQVPPNLSAALAASFFQMPQLWNPYAWGVPWPAAWNMANTSANPSNGVYKRPRSPAAEQGCALKTARMDEVANSESANNDNGAPGLMPSVCCSDATQTKVDGFRAKHAISEQTEEHSGSYQCQSPHSNPAAQVRSVAFQEGA